MVALPQYLAMLFELQSTKLSILGVGTRVAPTRIRVGVSLLVGLGVGVGVNVLVGISVGVFVNVRVKDGVIVAGTAVSDGVLNMMVGSLVWVGVGVGNGRVPQT